MQISKDNDKEFVIRKEGGNLLATYHPQLGSIPMVWSRSCNAADEMQDVVINVWGEELDIRDVM